MRQRTGRICYFCWAFFVFGATENKHNCARNKGSSFFRAYWEMYCLKASVCVWDLMSPRAAAPAPPGRRALFDGHAVT